MSAYDPNLFVDRDGEYRAFLKLIDPQIRQTGMLVSADEGMGKTWLVRRLALNFDASAGQPVVLLDFRHPREKYQMQDGLGLIRLIRDKLNLPQYFGNLNAVIARYTTVGGGAPVRSLQNLADKIGTYFNIDELRSLALNLNLDPENLPQNVKSAFAYALVSQEFRLGKLNELIDRLKAERGHAADEWEASLAEITGGGPGGAGPAAEDAGEMLRVTTDRERLKAEADISEAFFKCLVTLLADKQLMVLFIDHYDDANEGESQPEARRWVREQLLSRLAEPGLHKLVVIICGRRLPRPEDLGLGDLVVSRALPPFKLEHIREYWLERRCIPLPPGLTLEGLEAATGGVPGDLARSAKRILDKMQKADPFFDDSG